MAAKRGLSGLNDVKKELRNASKRWQNGVATGLYMAGGNIMTRSKRLVPVDLGALKNSGYVTLPVMSSHQITIEMGYGGPASDYAIRQHEDLTLNHPEGGQARYLSQAADEHEPTLLKTIQSIVQQMSKTDAGRPKRTNHPVNPDAGGSSP